MRTIRWLAGLGLGALVVCTMLWLELAALAAKPFTPPTPAQQTAAIGPTNGLSPLLTRAFAPGPEFAPIPSPGPQDWLGAHTEQGQTYLQFVQARYNKPDKQRQVIYLQPMGAFPETESPALELLRGFAHAYFEIQTRLLPAKEIDEDTITRRRNPHTKNRQFLAGDLMVALEQRLAPDAFCLLGVTMSDLYPEPAWNFVFGMASLRDRVGVYSFARYDPAFYGAQRDAQSRQLILRRSCQVLAHETAHMFGLEHCIHFSCLMNGANHLAENDRQPMHLCPVCLRKLQHSVGFDVLARYQKLQQTCEKLGLTAEAKWYQARIEKLGNGL